MGRFLNILSFIRDNVRLFVVYLLTLLIETESASLYLLVCKKLLVLFFVAYKVVLLQAALIEVTLRAAIKDTLEV